ncbi:hypothetical protein BDF19DRAFT_450745 [Syncephalis fuscata]|nr:hypothetical protein BDF19DRAFT_450745 [Syncephalis fuscata]
MPIIDENNPAEIEWRSNATTLWGIHLHPQGEVNLFNFYLQVVNNLDTRHNQLFGNKLQILFATGVSLIVVRNFIISSKMVMHRPRLLAPWCCLVPCVLNLLTEVVFMGMELGFFANCRILIWTSTFGISITYVCNSMILLQKAYLILCRQKWLLYTGIPLLLLQFGYFVATICFAFVVLDIETGCTLHYYMSLIWYWLGVTLPINMAQKGVQTMCLAVLCNITCCILLAFQVGGSHSDLYFSVDSIIVNTILVKHCNSTRKPNRIPNRPKTKYVPGYSQF